MDIKQLKEELDRFPDDMVVVCRDESGCWDNIQKVVCDGSIAAIVFGGGSPFSSDN